MTGGTVAHDEITHNLRQASGERLRDKPCRPLGPNIKIIVDGRVRYPDVLVVCGPVSPKATVVENPVIVFEVLSDGSLTTDLIEKNREYHATSSVQRYVILEQNSAAAMAFVRQPGGWMTEIAVGADATLRLPEIDVDVPLAEVYANIDLGGAEVDERLT